MNLLAKYHNSRIARAIARYGYKLYSRQQNYCYTMSKNGEEWLLSKLGPVAQHHIIDVGANVGEWSEFALKHSREPQIHCFEIVPETFAELEDHLGGVSRVKLQKLGLNDFCGILRINYYPESNGLSTAYDYPHTSRKQALKVPVITGDAYVEEENIDRINLLKIDVEGAEMCVLKGFEQSIKAGKIDVVQFEYGRINIQSKTLLKDFYEYFYSHGFVVGKLFPESVDFRDYRFEDENFLGPNYVAVNKSRDDLIRLLEE